MALKIYLVDKVSSKEHFYGKIMQKMLHQMQMYTKC